MTCPDLDSLLHPFLDGELLAADRAEFEVHLLGCPDCARRAEHERQVLDLIRSRAAEGEPKAPESLHYKLLEGIEREAQLSTRRSAVRWAGAAAAAGLVLFGSHKAYVRMECRLDADDAAIRFAREYPPEISHLSPEQMEAWFGGKLDYHVTVPRIPNAVATGGRLLNVREKQAALIRYDVPSNHRHIGVFVYGDQAEDHLAQEPEYDSSHGYNVVSWRDGDVVYRLVTDLEEQDVRQLVPPTRGAGIAREEPAPVQHTLPADSLPSNALPNLDMRPASLQR